MKTLRFSGALYDPNQGFVSTFMYELIGKDDEPPVNQKELWGIISLMKIEASDGRGGGNGKGVLTSYRGNEAEGLVGVKDY